MGLWTCSGFGECLQYMLVGISMIISLVVGRRSCEQLGQQQRSFEWMASTLQK